MVVTGSGRMPVRCPACDCHVHITWPPVAGECLRCARCGGPLGIADLGARLPGFLKENSPPGDSRLSLKCKPGGVFAFELPRRSSHWWDGFMLLGLLMTIVSPGKLVVKQHAGLLGGWLMVFALVWAFGCMYFLLVIVNAMRERQILELVNGALRITTARPFFPKTRVVRYASVDSVALDVLRVKRLGDWCRHYPSLFGAGRRRDIPKGYVRVVALRHDGEKTLIGWTLGRSEMEWLVEVIKAAVDEWKQKNRST